LLEQGTELALESRITNGSLGTAVKVLSALAEERWLDIIIAAVGEVVVDLIEAGLIFDAGGRHRIADAMPELWRARKPGSRGRYSPALFWRGV